jgi:apolipoprotein N-acyltransferase
MPEKIDKQKIASAVLSGLLLTGSFPKIGMAWLSWFALVPLLVSLRSLSFRNGFWLGFIAGLVHYLTLLYWVAYTMETYGNLPLYLSVVILFLLSGYLALYIGLFAAGVIRMGSRPFICFWLIPVLWVSLEYIRSFIFSGFPWGFLGHSQFDSLHLVQISDILGVYGISFLIGISNSALLMVFLSLTGKSWQGESLHKRVAAESLSIFAIILTLAWSYGIWRIKITDKQATLSDSVNLAIVQGNIDQTIKWDPSFQKETTKKYIDLSLSIPGDKPDLVVWPETATPFYFLLNTGLSEMVLKGIQGTGTTFLIGSPSFIRKEKKVEYYNSAYLIDPSGKVNGKYDKAHLVPFGEYVPFKKWLPFLGKIVEQVGDFRPGKKGDTLHWKNTKLGIQICFEIIFPQLSRIMVKNDAGLLVNITNDAWFGTTSAPYQHFSMAVFRAVENRRALIRSANTGISGFVDPAGRIIATTPLFRDATLTRSVPIMKTKTFYTRFGDLFAMVCLAATLLSVFMTPYWMHEKKR